MEDQFKKIWAPLASIVGGVLLVFQLASAFTGNRTLVTGLLILVSLIAIGAGIWNYAFAKSVIPGIPKYSFHWLAKIALSIVSVLILLSFIYVFTILNVISGCCGSALNSIFGPRDFPGKIEFASDIKNKEALNSDLEWDAGSSEWSVYAFNASALDITAGPHTWPNFPMMSYKQPIAGDFSATVKVIFTPEAPV